MTTLSTAALCISGISFEPSLSSGAVLWIDAFSGRGLVPMSQPSLRNWLMCLADENPLFLSTEKTIFKAPNSKAKQSCTQPGGSNLYTQFSSPHPPALRDLLSPHPPAGQHVALRLRPYEKRKNEGRKCAARSTTQQAKRSNGNAKTQTKTRTKETPSARPLPLPLASPPLPVSTPLGQ
jgi:hypothetical protein